MANRRNRQATAAVIVAGLFFILQGGSAAWGQNFSNWTPETETSSGKAVAPQTADKAEEADDLELGDILAMTAPAPEGDDASRYTLGPTDVISVTVMRHPEVSGQYEINNEGKMQYEFVGDVLVQGLTKDEVAQLITQRLEEFIINPEVTVKIAAYNSKIAFVVGEVYNPGKIFMRGDTITVRDALIQAGLPMLTGVVKKSYLITPAPEKGAIKKRRVNVYALLYEGDLRENFVMNPGDVLYIPPTFLTKTMRAIQPVASPIGTAAGTSRTVSGGF